MEGSLPSQRGKLFLGEESEGGMGGGGGEAGEQVWGTDGRGPPQQS